MDTEEEAEIPWGASGKVNLNVCRGHGIEEDAEVANVSRPL